MFSWYRRRSKVDERKKDFDPQNKLFQKEWRRPEVDDERKSLFRNNLYSLQLSCQRTPTVARVTKLRAISGHSRYRVVPPGKNIRESAKTLIKQALLNTPTGSIETL